MTRWVPPALALSLLLAAAPVYAQQFGQWSWDASVGAQARDYSNEVDGAQTATYGQRDFRLDLGLNGFIVHPAIVGFRLELNALSSKYRDGLGLDSSTLGFRADVSVLPESAYPSRVYASRSRYSYGLTLPTDPLAISFDLPGTATVWGARVRARRGPLAGLLVGVDHSGLAFRDRRTDDQLDDHTFADWSGSGDTLQHHYRLEKVARDYGRFAFKTTDTTFTADEHGEIAERWRWDLSASAIERRAEFEGRIYDPNRVFRLRNALIHSTKKGNELELTYDAALARFGGPSDQSHIVFGRYRILMSPSFELTPYLGYAHQASNRTTAQVPQGGLGATWHRTLGQTSVLLSSSAGYGSLQTSAGSNSSFLVTNSGLTIGHGHADAVREELEVAWVRNEARRAGEVGAGLPDLGSGIAAIGTQDERRARITLTHQGNPSITAYSEWRKRTSAAGPAVDAYEARDLVHTLQFNWRGIGATVNAGSTDVTAIAAQRVDFVAGTLSWRPWGFLAVTGGARRDTRQVEAAPDLRGRQIQAGVEFSLGLFSLRGTFYELTEDLASGARRTNRGTFWSLTRRFSGWLPIVSAPQRRGIIR